MHGHYSPTSNEEWAWTQKIWSVRKDVECTFGILKNRFRILKTPMLFHDKATIDDIFWTCCVLHNMLLDHDEIETAMLENAQQQALTVQPDMWQETDRVWAEVGLHEECDVRRYNRGAGREKKGGFTLLPAKMSREYDASRVKWHECNREVGCEREPKFFELRDALVTHHWYAMRHGKLRWIG